jgi:hypothetical protein
MGVGTNQYGRTVKQRGAERIGIEKECPIYLLDTNTQ